MVLWSADLPTAVLLLPLWLWKSADRPRLCCPRPDVEKKRTVTHCRVVGARAVLHRATVTHSRVEVPSVLLKRAIAPTAVLKAFGIE